MNTTNIEEKMVNDGAMGYNNSSNISLDWNDPITYDSNNNYDYGTDEPADILFKGYSFLFDKPLDETHPMEYLQDGLTCYRKALHMSQIDFTQKFKVGLSTWRNWEQGKFDPPAYFIEYLKEYYINHQNEFDEEIILKQYRKTKETDKTSVSDRLKAIERELHKINEEIDR